MLNAKKILTNGTYSGTQLETMRKTLNGVLTIYNNGQQLEFYISKDGKDFNHMCLVDPKTVEWVEDIKEIEKTKDEIESLKTENESLKCASKARYEERTELLTRLKDAQQEAESGREWANSLHNELLTLRGEVAAYKHCIAAITGTEIPLEITGENRGLKL